MKFYLVVMLTWTVCQKKRSLHVHAAVSEKEKKPSRRLDTLARYGGFFSIK